MTTNPISIEPYSEAYKQQVLTVWERAVLATHDFLSASDFTDIKALVSGIDFSALQVFCLVKEGIVLGFIGVSDRKIEMLFVDPGSFGKGLGRLLLMYAINELKADKVDVNEQNQKARHFYEKFGFQIFERVEKDDQGMDYPLLRMKLRE